MKLGRLLPALALGMLTTGAHAQISAYFNPIVTRVSNSQVDNTSFSYLGANNTSGLRGGVSIGAGYTFPSAGKLAFGVDLRDEWQRGSDSLLNDFLFGVRVQGKVGERLKPYAQVSGGAGYTRSPFNQVHTSKGMFKVYGGLDYVLNKRLDFRAVEIGYGTLSTSSGGQYGIINYPSSTLISFSSGLVVKF